MTNSVGNAKVKAVQEPGYANVWTIQDATGSTVARMTVNGDAEAWAKRIEAALNTSDAIDDAGRDQFEAYWMTRGIKSVTAARASLGRDSDNDYHDESTQRHWWTWRNALKCSTSQK